MNIEIMDVQSKIKLASFLAEFVSHNKKDLIEEILPQRTRYLTVVLEDIYQPHNASAVIRSSEAFGVQDLHVIEKKNQYRINPDITIGANKWVTICNYAKEGKNNTVECMKRLKKKGYKLVATTLRTGSIQLKDVPIDNKLALCFGNEEDGLSDDAHKLSDYFVKIPMTGFSQSLNLSVSAAICMYDITTRLKSSEFNWALSKEEQIDIRIQWLLRNLKNPEKYLKKFSKQFNQ